MEKESTAIYVLDILKMSVILLGLLGNFFSFLVFSRKTFAKYSISVYFRAMAMSECLVVYKFVHDIFYHVLSIRLSNVSNFWCKIHFYLLIGTLPVSVWLLAAFSIDKMIHSLGKRHRFAFIEKKSFQLAVVVGIVTFHLLAYSFLPIKLELKQMSSGSNFSCMIQSSLNQRHLGIFVLLEANVIPFIIMTMSTGIIIVNLNRSRHNLERWKGAPRRNGVQEVRHLKDLRFAVSSIVLNILDVIFELPIHALHIIKIENPASYDMFVAIGSFLYYFSFSISFFVHFTFNRLFRKEFLLMVRVAKASNSTQIIS
jgi:hypothetical protein